MNPSEIFINLVLFLLRQEYEDTGPEDEDLYLS